MEEVGAKVGVVRGLDREAVVLEFQPATRFQISARVSNDAV